VQVELLQVTCGRLETHSGDPSGKKSMVAMGVVHLRWARAEGS
jgi:hypothetical protein